MGDIVHNLRSSLDYTASAIVGADNKRVHFPIAETREDLVASFRTEPEVVAGKSKGKGRNAALEVCVPGIKDITIDTIGPYKSSGGLLWHLGKLDARNKHRLLLPVTVPQTITCWNLRAPNNIVIGKVVATVQPGGICRVAAFGGGGVTVERYGEPTADILFDEVGILQGNPVLQTILDMTKATFEAISLIEDVTS
ncbi:hypothetical protein [Roseobacter fucihabitans]|uniref:hypothetical protein n=1 Tax=Roseobacter fucihabitans TaxID=1537242 RepID=UPI001652DD3F|nr:hypothetical protein [Roseobacter litoralis]